MNQVYTSQWVLSRDILSTSPHIFYKQRVKYISGDVVTMGSHLSELLRLDVTYCKQQ